MADIGLDLNPTSTHYKDLALVNEDLEIVEGTTQIQQHILQRLRIFLGEWFMDSGIGLPYFQEILVKNPDQSKIDALFFNTIQETPGVVAITYYKFNVDLPARKLSVSFRAQTTSGTVSYNGLVDF